MYLKAMLIDISLCGKELDILISLFSEAGEKTIMGAQKGIKTVGLKSSLN